MKARRATVNVIRWTFVLAIQVSHICPQKNAPDNLTQTKGRPTENKWQAVIKSEIQGVEALRAREGPNPDP
jgi:hypothetical protein